MGPTSPDSPLGALVLETRTDRLTRIIFTAGAVLGLGGAALLWPEFEARFGGVVGWLRTLGSAPEFAAGGIILPLAAGLGSVALWKLVGAVRGRVRVFEHGIAVDPGARRARWDEVVSVHRAVRRVRSHGIPLGDRHSLRLELDEGCRIDLPHRYVGQLGLVTTILDHLAGARERTTR